MSQSETNVTAGKRAYNMSKRAESAARTERAIFEAAAKLWQERPFVEITLDAIAELAGVSVRTVIRRYGSKEGLYEIGIQNQTRDMPAEREKAKVGDIDSAVESLLVDYEAFGDGMLRLLAVEEQLSAAKQVLKAGRLYHREWCERIFAPFLKDQADTPSYEERLNAFVAASDIYVWKLLRKDLACDLDHCKTVMKRLLKGLE